MYLFFLGVAMAAPFTADEAVRLGLPNHPDVARAEAEQTAARGETRQTLLFQDNPELSVGYTLVGDRLVAELSQPLSLTGEGLAAHRAAVARLDATEHSLDRARLLAAAQIRQRWIAASVESRRAALLAENFDLATRLLRATEARLAAGEASELDARLARLEQARAASELLQAGASEREALTELSAVVGQPVEAADLAGSPREAVPARSQPGARSDVAAARARADAANLDLRAARAATLPAVSFGAFFEQDGADRVAGPTLGVTLPLWHQGQARTGAAAGQAAAAQAELGTVEARADAEQRTSRDLLARTEAITAAVASDLDADATAALRSVEAGYAAGELDLMEVIFLQTEVVGGQIAVIEVSGAAANNQILALLAENDRVLLAGNP